jgi:hypothetical protein
MTQSIEFSLIARIRGHGRGWSFSPKDFTDLGTRSAIDISLHRLQNQGAIRRVLRGIYDYPKTGTLTKKPLSPDIWSVAQTIARKNGWTIAPSGDTALNALGLSTQVPATALFFTDGPNRDYQLGKRVLTFRHQSPKDLHAADGSAALVIQALKTLGKGRVNHTVIQTIREQLSARQKKELVKKAQYTTDWIFAAIKDICQG